MSKIKVGKDIADALLHYESTHGTSWKNTVLYDVARARAGHVSKIEAIKLDEAYSLYDLAEILLRGHETELTPEDILLKEFKSMNGACTPKTEFGKAAIERRKGFLTALDILGVKVEGVNA